MDLDLLCDDIEPPYFVDNLMWLYTLYNLPSLLFAKQAQRKKKSILGDRPYPQSSNPELGKGH